MTEPIKMPPDLKKDDWRHLKRYGYAPGEYTGTCHRCGETPTMDKRAITCRPCAETMYADEQKRKQEPSAWIIDGDLESLMAEGRRAVLAERNELRAEVERLREDLARLTTLRPACEHDGESWAIWYDMAVNGVPVAIALAANNSLMQCAGWTPLPDVKEPTP